MSTRSQIVIKNSEDDSTEWGHEQWFYRHSDGYPEGNLPQLFKFMTWLREERIRNNVEQSAGWLILIGAEEYGYRYDYSGDTAKEIPKKSLTEPDKEDKVMGWKCGAYEISISKKHGDIEWFYVIDLKDNTLLIHREYIDEEHKFTYEELEAYNGKWEKIEEDYFPD